MGLNYSVGSSDPNIARMLSAKHSANQDIWEMYKGQESGNIYGTCKDAKADDKKPTESTWGTSSCYNNKKLIAGGVNMSFVGCTFFDDRIIAFADTKSTLVEANGNKSHEMIRGYTKKVFHFKQFIIVLYGTNTILYHTEFGDVKETVEDWIEQNLNANTPYELAQKMHEHLVNVCAIEAENPYSFIAASKDKCNNICGIYHVRKNSVQYEKVYVKDNEAVYAGDTGYVNYFNFSQHLLIEKDEATLKKNIEAIIKWRDEHVEAYNPAGNPVNIVTWYPPSFMK